MIFRSLRQTGRLDLEAVEMATRAAMHRAGAALLSELLRAEQPAAEVPCRCGQRVNLHDKRSKKLLTALGPVEIQRGYYHCSHCGRGVCPCDAELDVVSTACSPGVRRMMPLVGSESSFQQGRQQLELLL